MAGCILIYGRLQTYDGDFYSLSATGHVSANDIAQWPEIDVFGRPLNPAQIGEMAKTGGTKLMVQHTWPM